MTQNAFIKYVQGTGLGDVESLKVKSYIHTGCFTLNFIISGKFYGGLPMGKIIEVYGDPMAGKSLLMYHVFKEVIMKGGYAWYDDPEASINPSFAGVIGLDFSKVWFPEEASDTIEEHTHRVEEILDNKIKMDIETPMVLALDSVGALQTSHEAETEMVKRDLTKAQMIRKAMRRLTPKFHKANALYLVNNHSYETFAVGGQRPVKQSSGGGGLKFHSTVRLLMEVRNKLYNDEKKCVGLVSRVSVTKNRIIQPFQHTRVDMIFNRGIDPMSYVTDMFKMEGIIRGGAGGWYEVAGYPDKMKMQEVEDKREEIMKRYDNGEIKSFDIDKVAIKAGVDEEELHLSSATNEAMGQQGGDDE